MIPPLDPFSQQFDSIEIDPSRSAAAFDFALALAAPTAAAPETEPRPGFYLLNDAGGRFVVDRDIGVVSLKDDALAVSERGQIHVVRLRVIEPSGANYELDMQLRVTGRVPQMVGADDFAALTAAPIPDLTPVTRIAFAPERPIVAWARFTAIAGEGAPAPISHCGGAAYGALLCTSLPAAKVSSASLNLAEQTPAPSDRNAIWTI